MLTLVDLKNRSASLFGVGKIDVICCKLLKEVSGDASIRRFIARKTSSLLGGGVMGLQGAFRENSQVMGERLINDRNRASLRCRDGGHVPT